MEISVNFRGGGSFLKLPPIFSENGESIFVCSKNAILEYNTKTGSILYEYKAFEDNIAGFSYHRYNSFDCLSACSVSGEIVVWKTVTHFILLRKKVLRKPINTYHVVFSNGEIKSLISYSKKKQILFALYDVTTSTLTEYNLRLNQDSRKYHVAVSNENFFSVTNGNSVYFIKFNNFNEFSRGFVGDLKEVTCVACHPVEEMVLTGDTLGRVILWQNIFCKKKIQSLYHWHTLHVQTVSFSTSGSYFYSGGDECVLVKWQLDNFDDQRFVPRLAAEINHITVAKNNVYVAITTRDNALRILDSSLNQVQIIQHLVLGKHHQCGIVYNSRTKSLILNGNQGQLQFYSPKDMSLLYSLDLVGQNKITNERGIQMVNTEITKLDLTKCGLWLSTVEERMDKEFNSEVRLKFWKFSEVKQMFELNTNIEYPHEESINSLQFQPTNKNENFCCVTVGNDRKFKVWQIIEVNTVYKKGVQWKCLAVGFYRNLPCKFLSFSIDGSLLAVGFGSCVTTWLPESCKLNCSLVHPIYKEPIKQLKFGYGNQCHLIVAVSQNQLNVWNLLTLSLVWIVPMPVALLIADPSSSYMAVLTLDSRVFVFSPSSPTPVYSSSDLLKKYNIEAAIFVPSEFSNDARKNWFERTKIYFITSENELYCLSSDDSFDMRQEQITDEEKSLYALSLPQSKANDAKELVHPTQHLYEKDIGHTAIKKYLEAPLHTMAPIRFNCYSLIKSLVIQKSSQ